MRRIIHVTLWDVRAVLPLANGPRDCSLDGRSTWTMTYRHCPAWGSDDPGLVYPIEQWLRARQNVREHWLSTRRACTGQWLKPHNLRECFDSTEDPTCPACSALWAIVQMFKDAALLIRAEAEQAKYDAEREAEKRGAA